MPYCTAADLNNVFGNENIQQWADTNNTRDAGEISDRIDWAIESADADIDARLGVVFATVPFDPVPVVIKNTSAMLAGAYLYGLPRAMTDGTDSANVVLAIQNRATDTLDKLVMGKLILPDYETASNVMEAVIAEE